MTFIIAAYHESDSNIDATARLQHTLHVTATAMIKASHLETFAGHGPTSSNLQKGLVKQKLKFVTRCNTSSKWSTTDFINI